MRLQLRGDSSTQLLAMEPWSVAGDRFRSGGIGEQDGAAAVAADEPQLGGPVDQGRNGFIQGHAPYRQVGNE